MMRNEQPHLSDQDLLLAADGELSARQAEHVQAHLESCWSCRSRMRELEDTVAHFVSARAAAAPPLPPAHQARALLKWKLAERQAPPSIWKRVEQHALVLACAGLLGVAIGIVAVRSPAPVGVPQEARAVPDPRLTPGATLPLSREDVCAADMVEAARVVPPGVARKVFAAYGIETPAPRAYEVDYLVSPALGGSDNIRNFWPQPYGNTIWNAHIKDALEDRLRSLVCEGRVDLATAQRELAYDWIAAYKKYFQTDKPLPTHVAFLKDRPWE